MTPISRKSVLPFLRKVTHGFWFEDAHAVSAVAKGHIPTFSWPFKDKYFWCYFKVASGIAD